MDRDFFEKYRLETLETFQKIIDEEDIGKSAKKDLKENLERYLFPELPEKKIDDEDIDDDFISDDDPIHYIDILGNDYSHKHEEYDKFNLWHKEWSNWIEVIFEKYIPSYIKETENLEKNKELAEISRLKAKFYSYFNLVNYHLPFENSIATPVWVQLHFERLEIMLNELNKSQPDINVSKNVHDSYKMDKIQWRRSLAQLEILLDELNNAHMLKNKKNWKEEKEKIIVEHFNIKIVESKETSISRIKLNQNSSNKPIEWDSDTKELAYLFMLLRDNGFIKNKKKQKILIDNFVDENGKTLKHSNLTTYLSKFKEVYPTIPKRAERFKNIVQKIKSSETK